MDFKKILRNFKSRYFMNREYKSFMVTKNLKKMIFMAPVLAIFSFTMLLVSLNTPFENSSSYEIGVFYYSFMLGFSGFGAVFAFVFLKFDQLSCYIRNLPLYVIFIGFMILCVYAFYYGPKPFNAFVIFLCVITIVPLLFVIEPLVYNPTVFIVFAVLVPRIKELYSSSGVLNVIIFLTGMFMLGFQRWASLIQRNKHETAVKENEKKIQQELEMASIVQKNFYNHDLSNIKEWEVAYFSDPMISLSGDLFDFYNRQDVLSGLSIFDVSGHGLAAGLVTMLVKNTMEEEFYENQEYELEFTMQRINERVRKEKGNIENYLTGILLRFKDDKIEMVNAGHPTPIIYNAKDKTCDFFKCDLSSVQGAIGLSDLDFNFTSIDFQLGIDDRIILYTDGITEAKNINQEEYGKERFLQSVAKYSELSIQNQLKFAVRDVKNFIGSAPRSDDISIIILRRKE